MSLPTRPVRAWGVRGAVVGAGVAASLVAAIPAGGGPTALAASTSSAPHPLTGGATTFTSWPGLATRLLSNGLLPLPANGATVSALGGSLSDPWNFTMSMRMPVVGGQLSAGGLLPGEIRSSGGVRFVHPATLSTVSVTDFAIDVTPGPDPTAQMVVTVDNDPSRRIQLFDVLLTGAKVDVPGPGTVERTGGVLQLTTQGAALLNGELHTTTFVAGEFCGTADSVVSYR